MLANTIDFKHFPSTRYQGSKRKILPWIHKCFQKLQFNTVLDACGGSASVSYLLKRMGKKVTYNDKLHFNYLIGKALIENHSVTLTNDDIQNLLLNNINIRYDNFIERNFEGIYYLNSENIWLDRVVNNIVNMNHYQPKELEFKKALAFYAVFQASLIKRPFNLFHRKNLYIRTADVDRNFGNKTTWEKSFDEYLLKFADEANRLVFDSKTKCVALNKSILDIRKNSYDLVYIDPPYLKQDGTNESANYLKCYHFLEGLSKYKEWGDYIDYNSINYRLKNIDSENDFKRETIYETFDKMMETFRDSILVVSYKKGGLPSIEFIKKCMRQYKKEVSTVSMHYKYALNHQNGDAAYNREVLIIGE